jgi:proteasome assembly chaperone (PAC2) family protein
MAAVTADQISSIRASNEITEETVAITTSNTVYLGTLCVFATTGRIANATVVASRRFAGEVVEIVNDSGSQLSAGTGNTAGTVKAKIRYGHQMLLGVKTSSRTFTNLGKTALVYTNVDIGGTSVGTAGLRISIGQIAQFGDSTKATAWVWLRQNGDVNATA